MFIKYDADAGAQSEVYVPAFETGTYPGRLTGFAQVGGDQRGPKLELTFEVFQSADRSAARRNAKAHLYLQHNKPQARGMFHNRLRNLGVACGKFDPAVGGTDVAACVGKWVNVKVTKHEGTNKEGAPTSFNYVDDFQPFVREAVGPAAPTAGTGAPVPPPPAYHPPPPPPPEFRTPETGVGYADSRGPDTPAGRAYAEASGAYTGTAGTDQTGYDTGPVPDDDIPFATAGYAETRSRRSVLASMPKVVW